MSEPTAYELYRSGIDLLEKRDHHAAALPLRRARELEPSTAMVREALGRALFGSQRYREAAEEFGVLVELEPVNHYAQFCLGRALQLQGLHAEARPPLTMAALLQPERADYRVYRDRTIAAIESGGDRSHGTFPKDPDPRGESSGRRRSGEGPWGAPTVEPTSPGGPAAAGPSSGDAGEPSGGAGATSGGAGPTSGEAGATSSGAGATSGEADGSVGDGAGHGPEALGGPPPRG